MTFSEPNQALHNSIAVSTALITHTAEPVVRVIRKSVLIIGVGIIYYINRGLFILDIIRKLATPV